MHPEVLHGQNKQCHCTMFLTESCVCFFNQMKVPWNNTLCQFVILLDCPEFFPGTAHRNLLIFCMKLLNVKNEGAGFLDLRFMKLKFGIFNYFFAWSYYSNTNSLNVFELFLSFILFWSFLSKIFWTGPKMKFLQLYEENTQHFSDFWHVTVSYKLKIDLSNSFREIFILRFFGPKEWGFQITVAYRLEI